MSGATEPGGEAARLMLAQALSPAFPVGGFAYSHGLEWAIAAGEVRDAAAAQAWIGAVLTRGTGLSDAVLLCWAMATAPATDHDLLDAWAQALCASRERWVETRDQGTAFAAAWAAVSGAPQAAAALPVAVGRAMAGAGLPPVTVAAHYLQAFVSNLAAAAVRFVPLGQSAGQAIVGALRQDVLDVAARAAKMAPDEIATAALGADLAAMRHETMETRIFRT